MLEYKRIDISEGIDVNKTNLSKECDCLSLFVTIAILKISVLNMNHDLMQKAMGFNNTTIVYIKENAYRIHFWYMSKDDAVNIMNGSNLVHKTGVFIKWLFNFNLIVTIIVFSLRFNGKCNLVVHY